MKQYNFLILIQLYILILIIIIIIIINQIKPKPSLLLIDKSNFALSFYLDEYSGKSSKFEHVREVGKLSESGQ